MIKESVADRGVAFARLRWSIMIMRAQRYDKGNPSVLTTTLPRSSSPRPSGLRRGREDDESSLAILMKMSAVLFSLSATSSSASHSRCQSLLVRPSSACSERSLAFGSL